MYDRCYCINSTKYLLKFGTNMALYFVTVWQSIRGSSFFQYPSSWFESIKRFKRAVIIRFDLDVSEIISWLLYNCRREVQNEKKFHRQKKEIGLPLYAITSMQNEPNPFLYESTVLDRRKLATCFLSNFFTLSLAR